MKTGTKKIKTERLVLSKFRLTDFFSAQKWYCDERTARYSQGSLKKSKYECFRLIVGRIFHYIKDGKNYYYWAVSYKGKMVGFIEMQHTERENIYSAYYMISPEFWGQGFATEAFGAVIEYMKTQGAIGIYASCDSNNEASFRVIEKCGLKWLRKRENDFHYRDGRTGDREIFSIKLNN